MPCFRPNLFYDVQFRDIMRDEFEDVKEFAMAALGDGWEENRDRNSGAGIIYCRTREGTEELAKQLRKRGVPCKAYHAGLKDAQRVAVQGGYSDVSRISRQYRASHVLEDLGWVDLHLGSSPGWWAATVPTYCQDGGTS